LSLLFDINKHHLTLLNFLTQVQETIARWWSEFTLQTKLMAVATLVVSLLMSGLTFWAVNTIQQDARLNDTRFGSDLGLLLAANVTPLIGENNKTELARFSHRFYSSTSSIRYMLYADEEGSIYLGIPFSESEVQTSLTIRRKIHLPDDYAQHTDAPMVRQHLTPDGEVTDVFVPIIYEGVYKGVLAIGTNPNPTVVTSSYLTRDVTIAVFVSIWVMVILGAVFNALTITRPIKELLVGVKNIASGNFKQRVDLPFGGELGELIFSFNEMAQKLERYEEQNIEELTAEKAKLETLVSTIADGAVLLDTDLQVVLVNTTARRFLNWEGRAIEGENVLYALPNALQAEITRPLHRMAKGDMREGGEFRVTLTEPVDRTIRILLTSVLDLSRETVKGVAITIQDITREAELNEAKSQFISNVSHELRTPLFNIKSFIETLHEYGEDLSLEEQREFLETANRETDRLTRLVNDVLDLSKLESCKIYHLEAVDLAQPVEQTLRTYRLNARDKEIELKQEIQPDLPPVLGHYDLLLQVFTNLVGNALKFTQAGGTVTIRASLVEDPTTDEHQDTEPTRKVRIEIIDTGIGIPQEDQHAIFDRFFRVENRVHTLEGTGLGLSIVRNIIEKHQSRIRLASEVGVGTTFWFDLTVFQDIKPIAPIDRLETHVLPETSADRDVVAAGLAQVIGQLNDALTQDPN
jgi:two-component system sensor histidine kinase NblS